MNKNKKSANREQASSSENKQVKSKANVSDNQGGIYGFRSQADKARDKNLASLTGMTFALLILVVLCFCFMIMLTVMLHSHIQNTGGEVVDNSWTEIITANNVGYKVRKSWTASGVEGATIFQPTETTAITVQAESIENINAMNPRVLCTADNLLEYIKSEFITLQATEGVSISDLAYREYEILDTIGYYVTFTQTQDVNGVSTTGYSDAVFFVYNSYLYSFSYATSMRLGESEDFNTVLNSIRIAPEQETNMTELPIGGTSVDSSVVDEFKELIPDSLTSGTTSSSTENQTNSTSSTSSTGSTANSEGTSNSDSN